MARTGQALPARMHEAKQLILALKLPLLRSTGPWLALRPGLHPPNKPRCAAGKSMGCRQMQQLEWGKWRHTRASTVKASAPWRLHSFQTMPG